MSGGAVGGSLVAVEGGATQGGNASGGASQGGASNGGASNGGASSEKPPVPPEVSATWTWSECGRIEGSSYVQADVYLRSIASLGISGDGRLLVSNTGIATAWQVADTFSESRVLWARGREGAFNTDVSADGRWVTTSGDTRNLFDARDGTLLNLPSSDENLPIASCFWSDFRFSPDSRYVAGKRYGTVVDVFDVTTLERIAELETKGCGQGLVFGRERLFTPEGSFEISDWAASGLLSPSPATAGLDPECAVYLVPSSTLRTSCCGGECQTRVGELLITGGQHASLSREEHWLVSGRTLAHLPSMTTQTLPVPVTESIFAPNGDIITGDENGNLVRFCRQE